MERPADKFIGWRDMMMSMACDEILVGRRRLLVVVDEGRLLIDEAVLLDG